MIIKSKQSDYYDYLQHEYGDSNLIYMRDIIGEGLPKGRPAHNSADIQLKMQHGGLASLDDSLEYKESDKVSWHGYKMLVFCGHYYPVMTKTIKGHSTTKLGITMQEGEDVRKDVLFIPSEHGEMIKKAVCDKIKDKWGTRMAAFEHVNSYFGKEDKDLLRFSKQLNAPVFMINSIGRVSLDEQKWFMCIVGES